MAATKKENYLMALRGEKPERVPNYSTDCQIFAPSAMQDPQGELWGIYYDAIAKGEEPPKHIKKIDGFGVTWVLDEYGAITEPGNLLLQDITEWREKFHIPDLTGYDWDTHLAEDMAWLDPDKAVELLVTGPFMQMVNAMGFQNTLIALASEEEETAAFLDAVISFLETVIAETLKRVRIDSFQLFDDFANQRSMFMSPDMFREMLLPFEKRLLDTVRKYAPDVPLQLHTCGKCEDVLPDLIDAGISAWQPAQPLNDLDALKKRYGSRLVLVGAWDNVTVCSASDITETEVKESVRSCLDRFARDGAFVFWNGGAVGHDPVTAQRLQWAEEEAENYGREIY